MARLACSWLYGWRSPGFAWTAIAVGAEMGKPFLHSAGDGGGFVGAAREPPFPARPPAPKRHSGTGPERRWTMRRRGESLELKVPVTLVGAPATRPNARRGLPHLREPGRSTSRRQFHLR